MIQMIQSSAPGTSWPIDYEHRSSGRNIQMQFLMERTRKGAVLSPDRQSMPFASHHCRSPSGSKKSCTHITTNDQESNTIRPPSVLLRVVLRSVRNTLNGTPDRDRSTVQHLGLHCLLPHKVANGQLVILPRASSLPKNTSIRSKTSNGDTDVVIDTDELLLIRCKFTG